MMGWAMAVAFATMSAAAGAPTSDDVVDLARVAVAEGGFWSLADHDGIWSVLALRARRRGVTLREMIYAYSSPMKRGHWVLGANAQATRPPDYPAQLDWSKVRAQWIFVMARAQLFELLGLRDPCRGKADHFGDRDGDAARARQNGWRSISCGKTGNQFWWEL